MSWNSTKGIKGFHYTCGFCGTYVGPSIGYIHDEPNKRIRICPKCDNPTFFRGDKQTPAPLLGNKVTNVPAEIATLYNEARACTGVNSFTATVLACRKLLMHIAVDKGADEGKHFIEYVEYLSDAGYVPPDGKEWVNHIRNKGNEANHEIVIMSESDALDLITFIEMLLKFIYEFPSRIPQKTSDPPS